MKSAINKQYIIQAIAIIILLLIAIVILITLPCNQLIANAEMAALPTPEAESAILTESDDVEGYSGKTIRDYEEIRTIPNIGYELSDLVLNTTTDDAIVKIVPKAYFMTPGDTLYVGKEYGFYIHTENCADIAGSNNMYSTVMVFDIVNSVDMVVNLDTAITKVEVLYQYEFIYLSPQEDHYTVLSTLGDFLLVEICFDSAHSDIVIPLARGTAEIRRYNQVNKYYLTDISFAGTLRNVQALDKGDAQYDPNQDMGAFFIGATYSFDGQEYVDQKPTADNVAEWFYTAASIVAGIVTFIPGPNLISALALSASAAFYAADIADAHIGVQQDVSGTSIQISNNYNTRLSQVQYDGDLTKTIVAAVNTTPELSYWYGNGDYATMEYHIASTPETKIPYTWFFREIGVKVVDEDGNLMCTPAKGAHDFKLYEEDYVELDLNGGTVYLLPKDSNTFIFEPQYSGKYVFDFGSNSNVSLEVDDVAVAAGTEGFVVDMEGGREYALRVVNKTDERLILDFNIHPTADRTVTIAGNNKYVVKLDIDAPQCLEISTDSESVNVGIYVKNANGELERYTPSEFNWTAASTLAMRLNSGEYYILLENTTGSSITVNVVAEEVSAVSTGDNNVSIGTNWIYFSFTPQKTGGYVFALLTDETAPVQMALYDSNMQPINAINESVMLRTDGFVQNVKYYVGIRTVGDDMINGVLTIEEWDNAFAWYVEGVKVQRQSVNLYQDWTYDIALKVNDSIVVRSFNQNNSHDVDQTLVLHNGETLNVTIPNDISAGTVVTLNGKYSDVSEYSYYLNITIIPNTMVMVNGAENFETETKFYLTVNDPLVEAINYKTAYKPLFEPVIEEEGTKAISAVGALCIVEDIMAQPSEKGEFEIISIVYNGRTVEYTKENSSCNFIMTFGKGSGDSANDPWVINCSLHYYFFELYAATKGYTNKFWKLGQDIDISESVRYLKRFYGTLDGGGHTLSGLAIDIGTDPLTADKNFGWLEENYGTIQNVTFSDVSITGGVCHTGAWAFIGVVAGTNDYEGLIENVQIENVNISVNRNMARIGGYVGVNKGTIKDCDAGHVLFGDPKVTMFSNGDMGIICGENIGTVDNCRVYFVTINYYPSVENRSVGGIVGYCKSGTISNCYVWFCKITIIGTDAGICPNIGSVAGHVVNRNMLINNTAGCIYELDLLTDAQKVNCGGSERQYGYEG